MTSAGLHLPQFWFQGLGGVESDVFWNCIGIRPMVVALGLWYSVTRDKMADAPS
jgi:hypothetical protein